MQFKSARPLQRNGKPEEIASLVSYLVSDQAEFVTGQSVRTSARFILRYLVADGSSLSILQINIDGGMTFD